MCTVSFSYFHNWMLYTRECSEILQTMLTDIVMPDMFGLERQNAGTLSLLLSLVSKIQ